MAENIEQTLNAEIPDPKDVKSGEKTTWVIDALKFRDGARTDTSRVEAEKDWKNIIDEREKEYQTDIQKGVRAREGNILHVAEQKTMSKIKPLSFSVHGNGATEEEEYVFMRGLMTVADKGGLMAALSGRRGAFKGVSNLGDAFVLAYIDKSEKYPIRFKPLPLDRVYVTPNADVFRAKSGYQHVDEAQVSLEFPYDQFLSVFGHFEAVKEEQVSPGMTPAYESLSHLHEHGEPEVQAKTVEVVYNYRLSKKVFGIYAGQKATILDEKLEDKYPFMMDDKPFIPLLHFRGWAKMKGFYNYGLSHLLIKEARQRRKVENWGDWGMIRNVKAIKMLELPVGVSKSDFLSQYAQANESLAAGRDGIMYFETNGLGNGKPSMADFKSDPVTQELERYRQASDLRVKRLGIPLDEIDRPVSESATQTLAEEQRSDQFAQEFMRQNAEEFQFMWELVIQLIKDFIDEDDDTPVDMPVSMPVGIDIATAIGKEQGLDEAQIAQAANRQVKVEMTMGMLKRMADERHWFVVVDELSGVIKSNVRALAEIDQSLASLIPNSPAYMKQLQKKQRLLGQDVSVQEMEAPQMAPGAEAAGNGLPQAQPQQNAQKENGGSNPFNKLIRSINVGQMS